MTVSVMLCTFNRLELTKRMMESFFKTIDTDYRLIVIDNGSTDGTVEWLQQLKADDKFCQGYHTHFNLKNMGIAIGRNQALLIADKYQDSFLATIDNDVEFYSGWLSECISIIKTNHKFAVGLNFEDVNYPLHSINGKMVQWKKDGNLGTACSVFHRKLHETIGFFITEFGLYGEEDSNLFHRARLAGWSMGYLPKNGIHFGVGDLDIGEYREFKTACHKKNLVPFQTACYDYMAGRKSIYIPFVDNNIT